MRAALHDAAYRVDACSRRIVGWRVASNMKTEMVLDALEMARLSRGGRRLVGLVTHSDAESQGGFNPLLGRVLAVQPDNHPGSALRGRARGEVPAGYWARRPRRRSRVTVTPGQCALSSREHDEHHTYQHASSQFISHIRDSP